MHATGGLRWLGPENDVAAQPLLRSARGGRLSVETGDHPQRPTGAECQPLNVKRMLLHISLTTGCQVLDRLAAATQHYTLIFVTNCQVVWIKKDVEAEDGELSPFRR